MRKNLVLFSIYASIIASSMQFTIVFPFTPFMVMYLGGAKNQTDTGAWAGAIASSLMAGRVISSPFLGLLCDKWGRKPVLLIGVLAATVFPVLYGICMNLYLAVLIRFIQGLLGSVPIASKVVLSEICTQQEQKKVMTYFSMTISVSSIIGATVGAFLVNPKQTGLIQSGYFAENPFILPMLVPAVFSGLSFVLIFVILQETLKKNSLLDKKNSKTIKQVMSGKGVFKANFSYALTCFFSTSEIQLLNLFAYARKQDGGFGFNPQQIGLFVLISTLFVLIFQKKFYEILCNKMTYISICKWMFGVRGLVYLIIPLESMFRSNTIASLTVLLLTCFTCNLLTMSIMTSFFILINNSVVKNQRGIVNGVSMQLSSLLRGIAPILIGSLFATTAQSENPFPFNYAASFWLLSLLCFSSILYLRKLPESLNQQLKEQEDLQEMTKLDELIPKITEKN